MISYYICTNICIEDIYTSNEAAESQPSMCMPRHVGDVMAITWGT